MDIDTIEQYILNAGSDSLEVFGGKTEGGIHIQQVADELAPCIKALLDSGEPLKRYLEIGAAAGGTAYVLHHFLDLGLIVIVDDNQHPKHVLRPYILKDIEHAEIIGNSRDDRVINAARLAAAPDTYDIMIIDGDHSYHGVKTDIENYLPRLREDGFLILHDTATRNWGCAVPDVAKELTADPRVHLVGEFISKRYPVCGISLFQKVAA